MIITLCGSLRYEHDIQTWHEALAMNGHTPFCMVVLPSQKDGMKDWYTDDEKMKLDLIHLSKIEESDAILVVNTDGYIGDSTAREILWAKIRGKYIYYSEQQTGIGILDMCAYNPQYIAGIIA